MSVALDAGKSVQRMQKQKTQEKPAPSSGFLSVGAKSHLVLSFLPPITWSEVRSSCSLCCPAAPPYHKVQLVYDFLPFFLPLVLGLQLNLFCAYASVICLCMQKFVLAFWLWIEQVHYTGTCIMPVYRHYAAPPYLWGICSLSPNHSVDTETAGNLQRCSRIPHCANNLSVSYCSSLTPGLF